MHPKQLINSLDRISWFFLVSIVGVLFGFLIYSNSFRGELVLDDANVVKPEIVSVLDKPIRNLFIGRPRIVADISFALNYKYHQTDVFGYHVVNFFIHLANSMLVFILALLLFRTPSLAKIKLRGYSRLIAATAAGIFLAHPIQTMAVSYITQRYASIATLFYLLVIISFLSARLIWNDYHQKAHINQTLLRLAILSLVFFSVVSFYLGLHSKVIIATLPLLLLIIEGILFPKPLLKWSLLLLPSVLGVLGVFVLGLRFYHLGFMFVTDENSAGELISSANYFPTQFRVFLMYIYKIVVPLQLNADYYFPASKSWFEVGVIIGICVWLSFWGLIVYLRKRMPLISFGLGWFLVTPLITSSFIPILDVINEYRMYLPMVGVSLVFATLIWQFGPLLSKWGTAVFVVGLILLYGVLTFNRNYVYQTQLSFWGDVLKKSPQKARGHVNYAVRLHTLGQVQPAIDHYQKALEIDPERLTALANLGVLYTQVGQFDKAMEYFETTLAIDPEYTDALNGAGVVYLNRGELEKAQVQFSKVLEVSPENRAANENLKLLGNKQKASNQEL